MELRHTETHKARTTIESFTQKKEITDKMAKITCAVLKPYEGIDSNTATEEKKHNSA